MNLFTSPVFWLGGGIVLLIGLLLMIWHERGKRFRPTQRRGVVPGEQPKLIVTDIGHDGPFNKVTHAYHVTTDPQAFARTQIPSGKVD